MNSSFAPLGPRRRNSLIISDPAPSALIPGVLSGRIFTPPDEREAVMVPLETGTAGMSKFPTTGAAGARGAWADLVVWLVETITTTGTTLRVFFRFFVVFFDWVDLFDGPADSWPARTVPSVAKTNRATIATQANEQRASLNIENVS